MEKNKKSNEELLKENLQANKSRSSIQVTIFCLIVIMCGAIGFLSIDIYIILGLFFLIPAVFSTNICLFSLKIKDQNVPNLEFKKGLNLYYSRLSPFYGCYDIIKGILKTLLFSICVSFLYTLIYFAIKSEDFEFISNSMVEMLSRNDMDGYLAFIEEDPIMVSFQNISSMICIVLSTVFLVLHVFKYMLNVNFRLISPMLSPREKNYVFNRVFKENRSTIRLFYFKKYWFVFLLILVAGLGGTFISYSLGIQPGWSVVIGISLLLIVMACFLPYAVCQTNYLWMSMINEFTTELKADIDRVAELLLKQRDLNEEQRKQIKEYQEKLKSESENNEENNEDKEKPGQ